MTPKQALDSLEELIGMMGGQFYGDVNVVEKLESIKECLRNTSQHAPQTIEVKFRVTGHVKELNTLLNQLNTFMYEKGYSGIAITHEVI